MMKYFFEFELGKTAKYFKTNSLAKSITGFLFTLVFLFIAIGIYKFFTVGFNYINTVIIEEIRVPITLFFYEVFLLILAGIIVFSSIVSGIFSLFRGEYDNWIISSPAFKMFPKFVFVKSLLRSIWPFFVVFLPAVLAFYRVYSLSILSLFFIFLSFIILLVILNALTLSAIIAVSSAYYRISQKIALLKFSFKGLIAILLFLVVIMVSAMWQAAANIDLVKLFRADEANAAIDISSIVSRFYFFPTHPFALEIINWQNNQLSEAIVNFFEILLLAIISLYILWRLSFLFYPLWQKLQEGTVKTAKPANIVFLPNLSFRFRGGRMAALFKKEALVSIRNPKGMLWFAFLAFIWLAQLSTNFVLNHNLQRHETDLAQRLAILQSLQFIIAVYFICSFTLRFVFPSFSLEKKTAWILASAPVNFKRIYFGKYLFYTVFFVVLGVLMSYINVSVLNLPFTYAAYSMLLFIAVVIFVVTLGLSMGAIFPNYETDDPEIISTSMPGLFFTAFSLIYGALGSLILYFSLLNGNISGLLFFVAMTFVLIAAILFRTPSLAAKKELF